MTISKYGRQYKPEMYFTGNDLIIAQSIYDGDTTLVHQIPDSEVNKINEKGICFLIYSIYANNEQAMEILLRKGANPNIYCDIKPDLEDAQEDITPLAQAARCPKISYVRTLLKYGANPNDTRSFHIALDEAVLRNDREMVDLLLDNGADINIQTKLTKATVVVTAADIHDFDMVNYLLDRGAKPMLRDADGDCLAYTVQHQINRGRGSDKYKKELQDLKKRLESMGVVFPVEKIPSTKEETYEYKPSTPMPDSTPSSALQAQNPQKKKWSILFDDDENC
ncbi:hypothetical protein FACS189426_22780 [Bacteroidia bacterium]|nr:hypothetical protein FACS189426_22780 [Bacteroidia bacterium]